MTVAAAFNCDDSEVRNVLHKMHEMFWLKDEMYDIIDLTCDDTILMVSWQNAKGQNATEWKLKIV